ncbi:MAG: ACT domain-containing protein [Eubacteriales bacterium]
MKIEVLNETFSVCKVADLSQVDLNNMFCFIGKTDEEISLVCPYESVPANVLAREDGWRAFRIQGVLDFSLVGILAKISALLSENGISIFALSTFNTDYILVKAETLDTALGVLMKNGYSVIRK